MNTFDQPYWNLMQLLGWVYLRDRQWVRKATDSVIDHGSYRYELGFQTAVWALVTSRCRRRDQSIWRLPTRSRAALPTIVSRKPKMPSWLRCRKGASQLVAWKTAKVT